MAVKVPEFEDIRRTIDAVEQPLAPDERRPVWFSYGNLIGVAKDSAGRFEVFLLTDHLQVNSAVIQRHMRKGGWRREGGEAFAAARIVIPGDPHYVGIAALIVTELLRHDYGRDPQAAFSVSEPLIEMALIRTGVSDNSIIGLLGELIVFEQALVMHAGIEVRRRILDSWTGYQRASRDFVTERVSLEVKSTSSRRSRHHISNLDQVTSSGAIGANRAGGLYLVSIGLSRSELSGRTLASQVDRIHELLGRGLAAGDADQVRGRFDQCLRLYGVLPGQATGYDHAEMKSLPPFNVSWEIGFFRVYDMSDDLIHVPRRHDLEHFTHVVDGSVEFEIELPDVVRGDVNPVPDLTGLFRRMF